jgi:Family of unknown function (DUF6166)
MRATAVNEISRKKFWSVTPVAECLYSGHKQGVVVRENGITRPLDPQTGSDPDEEGSFSWGSASPAGKRLAAALLKDALADDKRAAELADVFNTRVISILPERWTMTRARIVSYADMMARERISALLIEAISPASTGRIRSHYEAAPKSRTPGREPIGEA